MHNFKLIGIRPLARCHKRFIKNLQPGIIYQFYQEYSIYDEDGNELKNSATASYVRKDDTVPVDLYDSIDKNSNGVKINISAVAGKNGSGKSSLADLFFATVFVLSVKGNFLKPNSEQIKKSIKVIGSELAKLKEQVEQLDASDLALQNELTNNLIDGDSQITSGEFRDQILSNYKERELLEQQKQEKIKEMNKLGIELPEHQRLLSKVRAQIFYEFDNFIYELTIDSKLEDGLLFRTLPYATDLKEPGEIPILSLSSVNPEVLIPHFFYTIAVNYSHYSLNSNYLGEWIRLLFHKNDGYRTPIVINPMRTSGNFDINKEMAFARNRLLSNIILENLKLTKDDVGVMLTEHQYIDKIIFRLDKEKISRIPVSLQIVDNILNGDERSKNMIMDLMDLRFHIDDIRKIPDFLLKETLFNYIVNKIDNISDHYAEFRPGYILEEKKQKSLHNEAFLSMLIEDRSHVTYKLHQALNFLKYHLFDPANKRMFDIEKRSMAASRQARFVYSIPELYLWMEQPEMDNIMHLLPPSIFEVDFQLKNSRNIVSRFNAMSSGEQQMIHTVQSIIYHINNIQSAHYSGQRNHYRAINIILDEIELYFHPDLQRAFISRLTTALQQLRLHGEYKIEAINLLFLTHSPYILSDIASKNVLRLEVKRKNGKAMIVKGEFETFAANIHELLAKSFFINGTSIGEFAEAKINAIIDKIDSFQELNKSDRQVIDLIGDSFLKSSISKFITQRKAAK